MRCEQGAPNAGPLVEKTVVAVVGGTPPEGVQVHISWFAKFFGRGNSTLAPGNDRLEGRERDLFGPVRYEPWSWAGKIYGQGDELNAALPDCATRYDGRMAAGYDHWSVPERHHGASPTAPTAPGAAAAATTPCASWRTE